MGNLSIDSLNFGNTSKVAQIYNTPLQETKDSNEISSGEGFTSFFDASINMLNQTNNYQADAKQLQLDFASGKTDDMLAVTLAQEKAMTALNFTVQVTNKFMDAYNEIMRIQL